MTEVEPTLAIKFSATHDTIIPDGTDEAQTIAQSSSSQSNEEKVLSKQTIACNIKKYLDAVDLEKGRDNKIPKACELYEYLMGCYMKQLIFEHPRFGYVAIVKLFEFLQEPATNGVFDKYLKLIPMFIEYSSTVEQSLEYNFLSHLLPDLSLNTTTLQLLKEHEVEKILTITPDKSVFLYVKSYCDKLTPSTLELAAARLHSFNTTEERKTLLLHMLVKSNSDSYSSRNALSKNILAYRNDKLNAFLKALRQDGTLEELESIYAQREMAFGENSVNFSEFYESYISALTKIKGSLIGDGEEATSLVLSLENLYQNVDKSSDFVAKKNEVGLIVAQYTKRLREHCVNECDPLTKEPLDGLATDELIYIGVTPNIIGWHIKSLFSHIVAKAPYGSDGANDSTFIKFKYPTYPYDTIWTSPSELSAITSHPFVAQQSDDLADVIKRSAEASRIDRISRTTVNVLATSGSIMASHGKPFNAVLKTHFNDEQLAEWKKLTKKRSSMTLASDLPHAIRNATTPLHESMKVVIDGFIKSEALLVFKFYFESLAELEQSCLLELNPYLRTNMDRAVKGDMCIITFGASLIDMYKTIKFNRLLPKI